MRTQVRRTLVGLVFFARVRIDKPANHGIVDYEPQVSIVRSRSTVLFLECCFVAAIDRQSQALEVCLTVSGVGLRHSIASCIAIPMTAPHDGGQAIKGAWWMPRRREAMKDVVGCDMPRGAVKQALIRGSPNRETGCHWATRWHHPRMNS